MNNNSDLLTVNYDKVVEATYLHSIIRMTALMIQKNPYMTVGNFFKNLNNDEVEQLCEMVDRGRHDDSDAMMNLVILSEMLARAEGSEPQNEDSSSANVNSLCAFITCADLARKGLVKIFYDNLSFGEEMKNAIIVERISNLYD